MVLNLPHLVKHIDELRVYLSNNVIDVLAINETTLDSTIGVNEVHITGYEIVRRDRNSNGRFGGGVCFIFVAVQIFQFGMIYLLSNCKTCVFQLINLEPSLFLLPLGTGLLIRL